MFNRYLFSLLLIVGSLSLWGAPVAYGEQVSWLPGMLLGKGYDTVSGTVKSDCLNYQTVDVPLQAALQDSWNFQEISSSTDILSLTSVDAGASVNVGMFSASAEMSMLNNTQVSNYDVTVLAQVSREQKWNLVSQSQLKPAYLQVSEANPVQFMNQCGNRYVSGVLYGGTLYTVLSVKTSSQSDSENVRVAVRASYGPFGSGQGSVSQQTTSVLASHETTITGYATGAGANPIPMTLDEVKNRWKNFPAEVQATGGAPMQVILAEYPSVAAPINPLIYELAALRWDFATARREVRYVIDNNNQFYMSYNTWQNFLARLEAEANAAMTKLDAALAACRNNQAGCARPAGLRTPGQIRGDLPPRYAGGCGSQTLALASFRMDINPLGQRCGGDTEMAGHNPSISINSSIVPKENGKLVDMRTKVRMKEGKKDWTCFEQTRDSTILNLALTNAGCYLKGGGTPYIIPATGTLTASGGNDNHNWTQYSGGSGFLTSASCRSDTKGKDFGKVGCTNIRFANAAMNLNHDEDRMGPNDLAQSATRVWINKVKIQSDLKALDQKRMEKIDSTLKQLAPQVLQTIEAPIVVRSIPALETIRPIFKAAPVGQTPKPRLP
ncbi:MAG: hypothetical protein WC236_01435 [Gallionellaceae bacterium]|jgi:hypothetical protein